MERDRGPVRTFLEDFVTETRNELFPSREACVAFYSEPRNFQRLLNGEIGDNLIYKYRLIAGFSCGPRFCRMAMDSTPASCAIRASSERCGPRSAVGRTSTGTCR